MQKTKSMFKKICTCLLVLVMSLSPILFAGCAQTPSNSSGSTGGNSSSGGGSSSGDSSSSSNPSGSSSSSLGLYDAKDYFQNYKIAYGLESDDEKSEFMMDIKQQTNEVAFDILKKLYAQYGGVVDRNFARDNSVVNVTINNSGEYQCEVISLSSDAMISSTSPLFYNDISIKSSNNENLLFYDGLSNYAKYFTHENAISNDSVDADGNILHWNWGLDITQIESGFVRTASYTNFINNMVYRKKLEFAILLITSGHNITPTGEHYQIYISGAELIENLGQQYLPSDKSKITNESSTSGILEFYNQVDEQLFNNYYKLIDHSGYTNSEVSAISMFVCDEIIGTSLVSIDQTRFVNVVAKQGQHAYDTILYFDSSINTTRFLNDETILTVFDYGNQDVSLSPRSFTGYSHDDSYENAVLPNGLTTSEASQIDEIMYYAQLLIIYAGGQQLTNVSGNSNYILYDGTVEYLDEQIFNKFYDLDGDGIFNSDVNDINNDGNTQSLLTYGNDTAFSIRKQYFKNYLNTSEKIVDDILNALADEAYKQAYKQSTGKDYPFEKKYPVIPASYFADYDNDDMLFNNQGDICHMYSGFRSYQNMVLMPKQQVNLEECAIFFIRQNNSFSEGTNKNFGIKVFARYYDANSNSFAKWSTANGETEFYDLGTQTISWAQNAPGAILQINSKQILSNAKINGTAKGNSILDAFPAVDFEDIHQPVLLTKYGESAKLYNFVELPTGEKVVCYTAQSLPAEERTSYFEIIFCAEDSNSFQFCFAPTIFSKVNS